jgi:hypothetical protein
LFGFAQFFAGRFIGAATLTRIAFRFDIYINTADILRTSFAATFFCPTIKPLTRQRESVPVINSSKRRAKKICFGFS